MTLVCCTCFAKYFGVVPCRFVCFVERRVGRDAIDVRKLVKMPGVGRHISPGELVETDDQGVLETAKERIVPIDQVS